MRVWARSVLCVSVRPSDGGTFERNSYKPCELQRYEAFLNDSCAFLICNKWVVIAMKCFFLNMMERIPFVT